VGAFAFICRAKGKSAREAFARARVAAQYESGHGRYTGTIAEKHEFVLIKVPEGVDPNKHAEDLIEDEKSAVNDKWGPAGCIELAAGDYLFFGWASS
jgi:hypothetical protein